MKRFQKNIILLILLPAPFFLAAQKTDPSANLELILESVLENLEEEQDISVITEDLEELAETPLNINRATAQDLSRLHLLDEVQVQKLLDYRKHFGPFYSIFEMNRIDGFSPGLLTRIEPFIWFGPEEKAPEQLADVIKYGKHQVLARSMATVQKPAGYKEKTDGSIPFEGDRFRHYARYRFQSYDNISVGFTAEKDPGEAFFAGSNRHGFDFCSGHFSVKVSPTIQNITVGDFLVRSGQGLVLWQGFSTAKSLNTLAISKTGQGIRPFTSTDENLFFRGVATSLNFGKATIGLFYSRKNDDANLVFAGSSATHFSSLQTSGYHRTAGEIADEKSVKHSNMGAVANWNFAYLKIGGTFLYQQFELPFIRGDQLYNRFRFSGKENFTAGADYLFSKGKYQLFGEAAISKSKGKAVVQGVVARLHDQVSVSAIFRHFGKNYHGHWASPFAESSSAANESGFYLGTKILPMKFVSLSAYSDFYRSDWVGYSTAGPSVGWDVSAQADFRFSKKWNFYFRYKNEEKEQKSIGGERAVNRPEQTQKARLHLQFQPSEIITLKTRAELVRFNGTMKENGILVFQDMQFAPVSVPLNISARIAWFSTAGYNSRIYAFENDLLYTFSVPAFSGQGVRTYLNLKYSISKHLDCWLKLGNTFLYDRETISSGYNEIVGKNKTEIKFQVRLKL
jgi:hypothetical protein